MVSLAIVPKHKAELGLANSYRILQHGLKNWLEVAGRFRNDLQHLRCRCLLLQRLAQFIEQPRVLDGDDGLGGEVSEQLNLLFGERANLRSVDANAAYRHLVLEHGSGHHGTEADL